LRAENDALPSIAGAGIVWNVSDWMRGIKGFQAVSSTSTRQL